MPSLSDILRTGFLVAAMGASSVLLAASVGDGNDGMAIGGYDPVAYFTLNEAVKGEDTISYVWQGETWFFSSLVNRDRFMDSPEKYAPEYGGFCAYGIKFGRRVVTDPAVFDVARGSST